MKNTILLLIILSTIFSFSQNTNIKVVDKDQILGTNFISNTEITGSIYSFYQKIYDVYIDPLSSNMTVQLRGMSNDKLKKRGVIVGYNLRENKEKWSLPIDYSKSRLQQKGKDLILVGAYNSCKLDNNNGEKIWKSKNKIYIIDSINKIGIGYKWNDNTEYSNELEGINLDNGKVVWRREVNSEFGWDYINYLDKSTMLIIAAGIHKINIKDGKGWDYNTTTGNYLNGIGYDIFTGFMALRGSLPGSHEDNLVLDVVSNIIEDEESFYFSSIQKFSKIDKYTGDIKWSHYFKKGLPSKSYIFEENNQIYMINLGYAKKDNDPIYYGKPFIAAFDKTTGKQKYLTIIDDIKTPIIRFRNIKNHIYLAFEGKVLKYSIDNGSLINKKNAQDSIKYIDQENAYLKKEGHFVRFSDIMQNHILAFKENDRIISIDEELNYKEIAECKDLFYCYNQTDKHKFLNHDKITLILNNKGKKIAQVNASINSVILGDFLYDWHEESLIKIDLKEVIIH